VVAGRKITEGGVAAAEDVTTAMMTGVATIGMTTGVGAAIMMIATATGVAMTGATKSREKACACGLMTLRKFVL
jgi:hypothetical protein